MAKTKRKASAHAKQRIQERTNISTNKKETKTMVNNDVKKGIALENYNIIDKKSEFKQYINNKKHMNTRIFLYNDYVFIFNSSVKLLITMYPIPEQYLEHYHKTVNEATKRTYELLLKDRNFRNRFNHIGYFETKEKLEKFLVKIYKQEFILIPRTKYKIKEMGYLEITEIENKKIINVLKNRKGAYN